MLPTWPSVEKSQASFVIAVAVFVLVVGMHSGKVPPLRAPLRLQMSGEFQNANMQCPSKRRLRRRALHRITVFFRADCLPGIRPSSTCHDVNPLSCAQPLPRDERYALFLAGHAQGTPAERNIVQARVTAPVCWKKRAAAPTGATDDHYRHDLQDSDPLSTDKKQSRSVRLKSHYASQKSKKRMKSHDQAVGHRPFYATLNCSMVDANEFA